MAESPLWFEEEGLLGGVDANSWLERKEGASATAVARLALRVMNCLRDES